MKCETAAAGKKAAKRIKRRSSARAGTKGASCGRELLVQRRQRLHCYHHVAARKLQFFFLRLGTFCGQSKRTSGAFIGRWKPHSQRKISRRTEARKIEPKSLKCSVRSGRAAEKAGEEGDGDFVYRGWAISFCSATVSTVNSVRLPPANRLGAAICFQHRPTYFGKASEIAKENDKVLSGINFLLVQFYIIIIKSAPRSAHTIRRRLRPLNPFDTTKGTKL